MENKEILAIVNGEEFYGSYRFKKDRKTILNEILVREFNLLKKEYGKEEIIEKIEIIYKEKIEDEIRKFLKEKELITKEIGTEEELKTVNENKYGEMIYEINKEYFKELPIEDLEEYQKENNYMLYNYESYIFETLEEAEKDYKKLNSKEYRELILEYGDLDNQEERTFLEIYNNMKNREKFNDKKYKILKEIIYKDFGDGNIFVNKFGKDGYEQFIKDKIDREKTKIIKEMEIGEITKPIKINIDEENLYLIFILKDKKEPDKKEIQNIIMFENLEKDKKDKIKDMEIEIIYPEIKIEDEYFENEVLAANVNGKDIYIDRDIYNLYKFNEENYKNKLKDAIEDVIVQELIEEDEKEGMASGEYEDLEDYHLEALNITSHGIHRYINKNKNKLVDYEYAVFSYEDEDEEKIDEIYERLSKDNIAETIIEIFNEDGYRELTDREKEILNSFDSIKEINFGFLDIVSGVSLDARTTGKHGYENNYDSMMEREYYKELKKLKLKKLSKPKIFDKDTKDIYESLFLYNKINDIETIEESAIEFFYMEKEENYRERLLKKADIKYFIK